MSEGGTGRPRAVCLPNGTLGAHSHELATDAEAALPGDDPIMRAKGLSRPGSLSRPVSGRCADANPAPHRLRRRRLGSQTRADVSVDLVHFEVEAAVVLGVEELLGHRIYGQDPESGRTRAATLLEVDSGPLNPEGAVRVVGELVHPAV